MQTDINSPVIARLRSAEGQLKAVTTMVENGKTGNQIFFQLYAIQRRLSAITQLVLTEHLKDNESIIKFSEFPQERTQALDYLTMLDQ